MASTIPGFRLGRVAVTVFKDKSVSDAAQVPASGITVKAYVSGADCKSAVGSGIAHSGTGTINVWHPSDIRVGDTLMNSTTLTANPAATAPAVTVTNVSDSALSDLSFDLAVSNSSGSSFTWTTGDRMVVTSRRPTLYTDSAGKVAVSGTTTETTTSSVGLAEFYAYPPLLDLIITGSGVTTTIWKNQPAGEKLPSLNLNDYGGKLKDAIAAIDTDTFYNERGVEIYCPPGVYTYDAADLPITVDARVTIRGGGNRSTIFQVEATAGNENINFFKITRPDVTLRDFAIQHKNAVGTGHCVEIGDTTGGVIKNILIENVDMAFSPDSAIYIGLDDSGTFGSADNVVIRRCTIGGTNSGAHLEILNQSTTIRVEDCNFDADFYGTDTETGVYCVRFESCANVHFLNCNFAAADEDTEAVVGVVRASGSSADSKAYAANIVFESCDFENAEAVTTETVPLLSLTGTSGAVVRNCIFYFMGSGILLDGTYAATVSNCQFKDLGGSGYTIKLNNATNTILDNNWHEKPDAASDDGARYNIAFTSTGTNYGTMVTGGGLTVPIYADHTARDATSYSTGVDVKGARTVAGTLIWVTSPTSMSNLQVYDGSAWVGIAKWSGGAAAEI